MNVATRLTCRRTHPSLATRDRGAFVASEALAVHVGAKVWRLRLRPIEEVLEIKICDVAGVGRCQGVVSRSINAVAKNMNASVD